MCRIAIRRGFCVLFSLAREKNEKSASPQTPDGFFACRIEQACRLADAGRFYTSSFSVLRMLLVQQRVENPAIGLRMGHIRKADLLKLLRLRRLSVARLTLAAQAVRRGLASFGTFFR